MKKLKELEAIFTKVSDKDKIQTSEMENAKVSTQLLKPAVMAISSSYRDISLDRSSKLRIPRNPKERSTLGRDFRDSISCLGHVVDLYVALTKVPTDNPMLEKLSGVSIHVQSETRREYYTRFNDAFCSIPKDLTTDAKPPDSAWTAVDTIARVRNACSDDSHGRLVLEINAIVLVKFKAGQWYKGFWKGNEGHFLISDVNELSKSWVVGRYALVLYDFWPTCDDEMLLKKGDIVQIVDVESSDRGWWRGSKLDIFGLFPDNYVQVTFDDEINNYPSVRETPVNDSDVAANTSTDIFETVTSAGNNRDTSIEGVSRLDSRNVHSPRVGEVRPDDYGRQVSGLVNDRADRRLGSSSAGVSPTIINANVRARNGGRDASDPIPLVRSSTGSIRSPPAGESNYDHMHRRPLNESPCFNHQYEDRMIVRAQHPMYHRDHPAFSQASRSVCLDCSGGHPSLYDYCPRRMYCPHKVSREQHEQQYDRLSRIENDISDVKAMVNKLSECFSRLYMKLTEEIDEEKKQRFAQHVEIERLKSMIRDQQHLL